MYTNTIHFNLPIFYLGFLYRSFHIRLVYNFSFSYRVCLILILKWKEKFSHFSWSTSFLLYLSQSYHLNYSIIFLFFKISLVFIFFSPPTPFALLSSYHLTHALEPKGKNVRAPQEQGTCFFPEIRPGLVL